MELWIRHQDGTRLSIANDIRIESWPHTSRIIVNGVIFGSFKKEEDALKVLNDIQTLIYNSGLFERSKKIALTYTIPEVKL